MTGFIAEEGELVLYNAKALIDLQFEFVYLDDDNEEQDFGFEGYVSAYWKVYNDEKRTELIKSYAAQITQTSKYLYVNASVDDMTFEDQGPYYYEIGYNRNGYEIPLRYGKQRMI